MTPQDYSVFGTQLLEILLQFKWEEGGGRTTFFASIGTYLVYLCLATAFNVLASTKLGVETSTLLDEPAEHAYLLFGWLLTSAASVRGVLWMAWSRSWADLGSAVTLLGAVCDALQLLANLLFLLRDGTPGWVSGGDAGGLAPSAAGNATELLLRGAEAAAAVSVAADEGDGDGASSFGAAQLLAAACGGVATLDYGESLGLLLTVQSLTVLLLWIRLVFFLRGFLAFGALVHMVIAAPSD